MMFVADLRLHPEAERVPAMTADEYDALVLDVERRGVVTPLDVLVDGTILDGRHRWQVASNLGMTEVPVRIVEPADPVDFMVRAAVLRRHLTTAQRKALAASLLVGEPSRSDRSIAKATGIDHKTVATVRDKAEGRGEIPHVEQRTDSLGRTQPATRPEREAVVTEHRFAAVAAIAGVPVELVELAERVAEHAPDLMPLIREGAVTLAEAEARIDRDHGLRDRVKDAPHPAGPGATLIPPATKELRLAMVRDMVLVPKMLSTARVLARVRPSSIAASTSRKDRPKMAARIREMIAVLESVAAAMDEAAGR